MGGELAHHAVDAGAEIHDHVVVGARELGQVAAEQRQAAGRQGGQAAGTRAAGDHVEAAGRERRLDLAQRQPAGDDAAEVAAGHQAELHVDVGQPEIAVEQQRAAAPHGQRVGQRDREEGLADTALARGNGDDVLGARRRDRCLDSNRRRATATGRAIPGLSALNPRRRAA